MKKMILLLTVLINISVFSQSTEFVFVYFKDKPNAKEFLDNPLSELTQKAIDRRAKLGIQIDETDAPIHSAYVEDVRTTLGLEKINSKSKWLNGVGVEVTPAQKVTLEAKEYVKRIESFVRNPSVTNQFAKTKNKFDKEILTNKNNFNKNNFAKTAISYNYGEAEAQISQVNLVPLHMEDNIGTGIAIAVLDNGFLNVNKGIAYKKLFSENRIKDTYNFVKESVNTYGPNIGQHGADVLSIIGGYINDASQQLYYAGSAPGADYYLYVTEDSAREHPEEEINFTRGLERADKMGVDIVTASLSYNTFDDKRYDYKYSDMNGTNSFVVKATNIAVDKGILVLTTQGNEGDDDWKYLNTPADSPKVLSVGSVNSTGKPSVFSSYGPNYDKVVKPDVVARGTNTVFVDVNYGAILEASGTSYSLPIVAGGLACLLQAIPKNVSRNLIRDKMRASASIYPESNDRIGYGIINFGKALSLINSTLGVNDINTKKKNINIYPNPVKNTVNITTADTIKSLELYDGIGRKIKNLSLDKSQNLDDLQKGIYYIKIVTDKSTEIEKIIKE